jgi:hypothetical protein
MSTSWVRETLGGIVSLSVGGQEAQFAQLFGADPGAFAQFFDPEPLTSAGS